MNTEQRAKLGLKPWHDLWCPAVINMASETTCECGGAEIRWREWREQRAVGRTDGLGRLTRD